MHTRLESLKNLIESFKLLPGIGEKTAERLAFYLINEDGIIVFANDKVKAATDALTMLGNIK